MILVFGKDGQVAQALQRYITGYNVEFYGREEVNFFEPEKVISLLDKKKPELVINASAYTQVDKAETERDLALKINATTPGAIASWCAKHQVAMVHFSTDYVFDGKGQKPWLEDMPTNPVNYYGETKNQGDRLIQESGCKYYILRVSWVYAPWGHNFPKTILKLAKEKEELSIVNDQVGSPTDAREIATFISLALNEKGTDLTLKSGVYHLRFKPYITWFDVATRTIEEAKQKGEILKVKKVNPIPSSDFPTLAKRPLNSRLDTIYPQAKQLIKKVNQIAKDNNWGYLG